MSHLRCVKIGEDAYDIYIGRPRAGAPWGFGNPFAIGPDGSRAEVIEKYERWLRKGDSSYNPHATEPRRQWILSHLGDLKGKILGCFCGKLSCHGDVLIAMSEELES